MQENTAVLVLIDMFARIFVSWHVSSPPITTHHQAVMEKRDAERLQRMAAEAAERAAANAAKKKKAEERIAGEVLSRAVRVGSGHDP